MKKAILLVILCAAFATGCGKTAEVSMVSEEKQTEQTGTGNANIDEVISQIMMEEGVEDETASQPSQEEINAESLKSQTEGVDVDLTALSSTMVYAEVYNMMVTPEEYLGKNIRMSGEYNMSYYEETDQNYHFVIINDALECCQSGLEFSLNDEAVAYPENGEVVEVTGVFDSYEELGQTYYYLKVDTVTEL